MLRAAGYSVEAFPSAHSFLADYDPRRGGCLLLDVRMPQMTGLELQQQLNVRGWRIRVIFITGHGTVPLAIAAMKAGAFDFLPRDRRIPKFRQITLAFGCPEPVDTLRATGDGRTDQERITDAVRQRVIAVGAASATVEATAVPGPSDGQTDSIRR